ncbi:methylaspartate ammonia-lyase [Candidatus Berkelbacteria bacterium]|nr:methylaspartate ammonia-lyase [Candidatus Berkelbacteria bacterium]
MTKNYTKLNISRVIVSPGVGGFWVQDQEAVQGGAKPDGFLFQGKPVLPGFRAIREPSVAYCVTLQLDDGQLAFGDCLTVFNAGHAGRPPPLQEENIDQVRHALKESLEGKSFEGFRDSCGALDRLHLEPGLLTPVAYGVSQALLHATALTRKAPMSKVLMEEYDIRSPITPPGLLASCGGDWERNVEKAIIRRCAMFPQSAIQTREECERLPEYVAWIRKKLDKLGGADYRPDLHFDFHSKLGEIYDNDIEKICSFFGMLVDIAKPYRMFFEDPFRSHDAVRALERMAQFRARLDSRGPECFLIADEWANAPDQVARFVEAKAAHAIQIKMPDNGALTNAIRAIQICQKGSVMPYLGGSCNETDVSARVSVHVGLAFSAWRMLLKPGFGFDEAFMIMKNELERALALM